MMKLSLDEAEFRRVGRVDSDISTSNYLKLNLIDEILGDISDEVFTIITKLESIQRLARHMNYNAPVDNIINSLEDLFDINCNYDWKEIIDELNRLNNVD